MDEARPPRLFPRVLVWGVVGLAVIVVLNWILSAVLTVVRLALLTGFIIAVGWIAIRVFGRD